MNGYNRVILMGTVGVDAEVRILEGGNTVANVSIAVNESYTDQSGVRQTKTQWFKIEAWKGLADFLGNYGKKGTAFLIEGKLKQESYEKDGVTMYSTKVVANSINFAGTKSTTSQGNAPAPQQASPQQAAPQQAAPQQASPQLAAPQQASPQQAAPVAQQQAEQYITNEQFVSGINSGQNDDLPF